MKTIPKETQEIVDKLSQKDRAMFIKNLKVIGYKPRFSLYKDRDVKNLPPYLLIIAGILSLAWASSLLLFPITIAIHPIVKLPLCLLYICIGYIGIMQATVAFNKKLESWEDWDH
jgi:hypothetical protein